MLDGEVVEDGEQHLAAQLLQARGLLVGRHLSGATTSPASLHRYRADNEISRFFTIFGDDPVQVGTSNMMKSLLVSVSEYCKNFHEISSTALPTWLLRRSDSLTPWSLPRPRPSLLFQINWRCRRLSSTRTPPDTVSRLSSITALYRSNHYQSRDIRTNTEPMSDTDPGCDCTDLLAR